MKLTILICTHNRAELLKRTLYELDNAERPAHCRVEVLVVVNACADDTKAVLEGGRSRERKEGELELRWIEEPTPGKSHALNRAIPLLTSSVIAFVDDDHRVDGSFLVEVCKAARTYRHASLFCGRILPDWDGREPAWVHDQGPYRIFPLPIPRFDQGNEPHEILPGGPVPGGGNLFLRREVFDRVGGFATELGPRGHDLGGGEDSDFVLRALNSGERLQYVPDVVQYHYVDLARLSLKYLIRKSYQRSRATVRIRANQDGWIPRYMWRKLSNYAIRALFCIGQRRRRFYLVRVAAALGEIRGTMGSSATLAADRRSI